MTTPSRYVSGAPLSNPVPSRSVLQKLLEEINDPSYSPRFKSPTQTPAPRSRQNSVWVGGATIAKEAREKLRAADEARQRKNSSVSIPLAATDSQQRRWSSQSGSESIPTSVGRGQAPESSHMFKKVDFTPQRMAWDGKEMIDRSDSTSPGRAGHSPSPSPPAPEASQPDPSEVEVPPSSEHRSHRMCSYDMNTSKPGVDGEEEFPTGGISRAPTFSERRTSTMALDPSQLLPSSFRPSAATPQGCADVAIAALELRGPRGESSAFTSTQHAQSSQWAKPSFIVEDDESTYKRVQGKG